MTGIYIIQNTVNKKCYVGSAVDVRRREYTHRSALRRGVHGNPHLQASFNKHGEAAFEFKVVEECPKDKLIDREQHWLNASKPEFNICKTAGSTLGRRHSTETCAKISATHLGVVFSTEHRSKIAAARVGKKHSEKARAKMSAANIGKKKSPEHCAKMSLINLGKKLSPETRAKMSAAHIGKKHSTETLAKMSATQKIRLGERNVHVAKDVKIPAEVA